MKEQSQQSSSPSNNNNNPYNSFKLQRSEEAETIRSHYLQQTQRNDFLIKCQSTLKQMKQIWDSFFGNSSNNSKSYNNSYNLSSYSYLLTILADFYLTYTTVVYNKRRLGQQYTYTTMFNQNDYINKGKTVGQKRRIVFCVLEVFGRQILWKLIGYLIFMKKGKGSMKKNRTQQYMPSEQQQEGLQFQKNNSKTKSLTLFQKILNFNLQNTPQIASFQSYQQYFFTMLFMLKWSPYYNFLQNLLKIDHIYTFKNAKDSNISYKIQGYMILIIFLVKICKWIYSHAKKERKQSNQNNKIMNSNNKDSSNNKSSKQKSNQKQQLCRICYDQIQNKTATVCGHIFCWQCIIKTVQLSSQCPVCRASCLPRQCVQLQNF